MKPKKKVEEVLRTKLRFAAAATLRDRWWTEVMKAQEETTGTRPAPHEPFIGRTIMRSPIVKLTSVAAVLAVAVLALVFWGRLGAPAYALEQTMAALQNIRFLHVVGRDQTGQITDERWIEVGMDGYQVRYRQQNPPELVAQFPGAPSAVIEDAESVAVYRQDKKAVILYGKDHQYQWIGALGEFFENLRQQGKILKENDTYQGRPAHKVWWPAASAECYIDPQTKLPMAVGTATLSYEEPPAGTFEIVVPDGYAVLDKRPGAVATAVPDWLQEEGKAQENKEEAFRQGAQALIRGDYGEAAKQFEQADGCDSWAWFWLGKAYYELGRYDLAIKNFDVVFDTFKKMGGADTIPFCQYARGLAYARLGMLDKATTDLRACLPAMIQTLRIPSGGLFFEYADTPLIRYGKHKPTDSEMVVKMINRLRIISGQNFSYDPSAAPAANEAAIAAWEQWFKNGGQIKFTPDAKLLPVPPVEQP
jgi:tetratricopeptide (TPR) repeat protein